MRVASDPDKQTLTIRIPLRYEKIGPIIVCKWGTTMTEVDIEIEAYGVSVTAFGATLHVRTPSTNILLVTMPRAVAERLAEDLRMGLDALPAGSVVGADVG